MDKQTIIIQGTERPFHGLQKLLGGFCRPKKEISDEDTITDGTHVSEPDLTSQVHTDDEIRAEQEEDDHQHDHQEQQEDRHEPVVSRSRAAVLQPEATSSSNDNDDDEEEEGEEVVLQVSPELSDSEKQPEIIATNFNRRNRVTRGLGVALVAILAVLATLFTLHRLGYDLANITFTSSDSLNEFSSKPLIKIQYNTDKKIVTMDPVPSPNTSNEDEDLDSETLESTSDEVDEEKENLEILERTSEKVDRVQEKLDELKALVADIQNDAEL